MLTTQEYEKYKKKLQDAKAERATLEARRAQQIEHLKLVYNLSPEEAMEELSRLREELPKKEAEFSARYNEFLTKWGKELGGADAE